MADSTPVFTEVLDPVHYTTTSFQEMYDFFLAGITDDMFMELTKEDTEAMLQEILIAALPHFEFPQYKRPFNINLNTKRFNVKLSLEEMYIIRSYMIVEWINFQLATVDLIRQKYTSSDFKMTSQAAHLKQLQILKQEYVRQGFHAQRLYNRRKLDSTGRMVSTFDRIMEVKK